MQQRDSHLWMSCTSLLTFRLGKNCADHTQDFKIPFIIAILSDYFVSLETNEQTVAVLLHPFYSHT